MTNRQAAIKVVARLNRAGFKALFAGGCVRDMLLGKRPKDYDIATDAVPDDVCRLFRRTIKVGAKFGVIIVLIDSHQIEVATFRTESGYIDGRRPENVQFSGAREDAARRDFTINGMFYDPLKKEVIDYIKGRADIEKKIIRTIGRANERFSEDYLRMLRAIRFATRLNFAIAPAAFRAIKENCKKITNVSGERIAMELQGIAACQNRADGIEKLMAGGLGQVIFPIFKQKKSAQFACRFCSYLSQSVSFPLVLAAMFGAVETADAMKNLKVMKLSRNQIKHIEFLLNKRGALLEKDMPLAKFKTLLAKPYFEDLYKLQMVIQKAKQLPLGSLTAFRRRANSLAGVELRPKPLLNGRDLMSLGVESGPQVGIVADELYIEQLSERIKTPTKARAWVKKWLENNRVRKIKLL